MYKTNFVTTKTNATKQELPTTTKIPVTTTKTNATKQELPQQQQQ